jgi:Spy/CpxP family protein refolding chaperone
MEKAFRENDHIRKQMDEARGRVLLILSAPEFDEAAYQAETAKLEELRGVMMQRFADATRDLAKQFNQEERKALSEHLRQPPPLPPPH